MSCGNKIVVCLFVKLLFCCLQDSYKKNIKKSALSVW